MSNKALRQKGDIQADLLLITRVWLPHSVQ